jgi:thiol:disulfide interchange protein DsbD
LPKSGGWLNAVKVVFAFIMLLFSLIFLGLLGGDLIPRDFILAIGVAILFFLGLYLIGQIKFSHDSDLPYVSVPRILLAILSWAFALYLTTGIFGAPLTKIAPFLPPEHTLGINLANTSIQHSTSETDAICNDNPKFSDKLHLPYGLRGYFDWDEALACAQNINKPVLVDFVGHTCKNCKKMYAEVWSDPKVQKMLAEDFVILALYTDDRTKLPEKEWVTSTLDGRIKKTMGKKNLDFQVSKFNSNALPMYVIVNQNGDILTKNRKHYTYSNDIPAFIEFLEEGLNEFTGM